MLRNTISLLAAAFAITACSNTQIDTTEEHAHAQPTDLDSTLKSWAAEPVDSEWIEIKVCTDEATMFGSPVCSTYATTSNGLIENKTIHPYTEALQKIGEAEWKEIPGEKASVTSILHREKQNYLSVNLIRVSFRSEVDVEGTDKTIDRATERHCKGDLALENQTHGVWKLGSCYIAYRNLPEQQRGNSAN